MSRSTACTGKVAAILGECLLSPEWPRGPMELTDGAWRSLTWRLAGSMWCGGLSLPAGWERAHQLLAPQGRSQLFVDNRAGSASTLSINTGFPKLASY